jgi:ribosomal protein L3 glutamine methyltransferase
MSQIGTVEQAIAEAAQKLVENNVYCGHGTDNPWDEACLLFLYSIGLERADESILDEPITPEAEAALDSLIKSRINQRVPAAYLIGEAEFAGLRFKIDERVLVPRSPIAELILNEFRPWIDKDPNTILDLCTGSGCIGIASAITFPETRVVLTDLSTDALDVAEENIQRHQLEGRCQIIESDIFENLVGQNFDLILSNPPYVDQRDLGEMPTEYQKEPALGLAAGADGLDIVRPMLLQAADHLNHGGSLIVEVGNSCVALEELYPEVPFTWIECEFGGDGVFILTKEQLLEYQGIFQDRA